MSDSLYTSLLWQLDWHWHWCSHWGTLGHIPLGVYLVTQNSTRNAPKRLIFTHKLEIVPPSQTLSLVGRWSLPTPHPSRTFQPMPLDDSIYSAVNCLIFYCFIILCAVTKLNHRLMHNHCYCSEQDHQQDFDSDDGIAIKLLIEARSEIVARSLTKAGSLVQAGVRNNLF